MFSATAGAALSLRTLNRGQRSADIAGVLAAGTVIGSRRWSQPLRYCVVGASGYGVNLVAFALLLSAVGLHHAAAATGSFLVAVTNNYSWNRVWTFRERRGPVAAQGLRFFLVSVFALEANLLALQALVDAGVGRLTAQAVAIALVTPIGFFGNRLWSFRR